MRREEEEAARSELVSLIRVPQEHRTADQVRRITAASRILSTAHKRKRKKRTPKSSSFRSSSGQGSRSRSSSSGGCGRLREHVRQVPAVADLQWKVPPSISSTKWWTFQLCHGDRYGCYRCSTRTRLFPCPVLCNHWPSWSSQCRKPCWCCSCSSSKVDGLPQWQGAFSGHDHLTGGSLRSVPYDSWS